MHALGCAARWLGGWVNEWTGGQVGGNDAATTAVAAAAKKRIHATKGSEKH